MILLTHGDLPYVLAGADLIRVLAVISDDPSLVMYILDPIDEFCATSPHFSFECDRRQPCKNDDRYPCAIDVVQSTPSIDQTAVNVQEEAVYRFMGQSDLDLFHPQDGKLDVTARTPPFFQSLDNTLVLLREHCERRGMPLVSCTRAKDEIHTPSRG